MKKRKVTVYIDYGVAPSKSRYYVLLDNVSFFYCDYACFEKLVEKDLKAIGFKKVKNDYDTGLFIYEN
jgi:hypothetical protein